MFTKFLDVLLLSFLTILICVASASAHGGGLDAYGGHNDRKHGGYHFHRGPLAGQSFSSKEEAIRAVSGDQQKTTPSEATKPATGSPKDVDQGK